MKVADVLRALEWALIFRLEGDFGAELQAWSKQSGIDMMGTDAIEADDLAEIVRDRLRDPAIHQAVIANLAEMANLPQTRPATDD